MQQTLITFACGVIVQSHKFAISQVSACSQYTQKHDTGIKSHPTFVHVSAKYK